MASQRDPDKTRSDKWRNQLSGLYQLIAEHGKEVDASALYPRVLFPHRPVGSGS